jgi:hypothetical protein
MTSDDKPSDRVQPSRGYKVPEFTDLEQTAGTKNGGKIN